MTTVYETKYYGISVQSDTQHSFDRFFLVSDRGDERYTGTKYPTERQVETFRNDYR